MKAISTSIAVSVMARLTSNDTLAPLFSISVSSQPKLAVDALIFFFPLLLCAANSSLTSAIALLTGMRRPAVTTASAIHPPRRNVLRFGSVLTRRAMRGPPLRPVRAGRSADEAVTRLWDAAHERIERAQLAVHAVGDHHVFGRGDGRLRREPV